LRRLAGDYKADYRVCVFDAKEPTFRDEWYPQYKANRPPMPDNLAVQVAPLFDAVKAEGWPLLSIAGVEADDVIGTLARLGAERNWEVVISTGDKDLTQLVRPGVLWVNTMSEETLDEAGVEARFGVPPSRIVDYLALVGDTVDNVPGVEKCGPKTAAKWLAEYGNLDNLVAHAGEIDGKVGENLRRHRDFLPLARRLVTIATDVALPCNLDDLALREPDFQALTALYERFEFKSWLGQGQGGQTAATGAAPPALEGLARRFQPDGAEGDASTCAPDRSHYRAIVDWPDFEALLRRLESDPSGLVAIDTETTGLEPLSARLVGVSFAFAPGDAAYLPLAHRGTDMPVQLPFDETLARLKPWLESEEHAKLGQNIKFDAHIFANHGITLRGIAHDTLIQSYVLESNRPHDMDSLAKRHLGLITIPYTDICGSGAKRIGFDEVALDTATRYAAEDADITLRLHQKLWPQVDAAPGLGALYRDIELPVLSVLLAMERTGVLIDPFLLAQQSNELGRRLLDLEREAHALAGEAFNLGSPKQLGEILFGRLGLPVRKKTATGQPSTDEDILSELAEDYPLPKLLLEHRGLAKLKGTYTDKLPRMVNPATGRVHTSFSQATAVTGRLASSDPNLQNIPVRTAEGRRIRAAFVAPRGWRIVSADYSQIELRIMAHLSNDPRLLDAFARNEDIHRATAAEVFGIPPETVASEQRRYAKVINFGLIYGMSAHGLAKTLGIERSAAQGWIDRYFTRYTGVAAYMERVKLIAHGQGYVETVFGRRLHLPDIAARQFNRRQAAERAAINAPMQGTAADLIKKAMIAVYRWLNDSNLQSRLVLQVHDELVLEVPDGEITAIHENLPKLMENVVNLAVPLRVDVGVGANWDEAH
ncbi:MAG: DNA polymerase I, partial [Betaproteobacteria bacterium]|nr:DNA polymerase I [Betaproteobacteria bacterium]